MVLPFFGSAVCRLKVLLGISAFFKPLYLRKGILRGCFCNFLIISIDNYVSVQN